MNLLEFERALKKSWCRKTCFKVMRSGWSEDNPTHGQCFVTVLVVQDFFGGEILKAKLDSGISHYWNLIKGEEVDFTKDQLKNTRVVTKPMIINRKDMNEDDRYVLLKKRVLGLISK